MASPSLPASPHPHSTVTMSSTAAAPLTTTTGATYPASLSPYAVSLSTHLAQPGNSQLSNIAAGGFIFRRRRHPLASTQILLIRRSTQEPAFPNLWEVPGGGIDDAPADATLLDGLVREVREETGLVVTRIDRFVGQLEFPGRFGRMWRKYNFIVHVKDQGGEGEGDGEGDGDGKGEMEVRLDPEEHSEWGWFELGQVDGLDVTTQDQRRFIRSAFQMVLEEEGGRKGEGEEAVKAEL